MAFMSLKRFEWPSSTYKRASVAKLLQLFKGLSPGTLAEKLNCILNGEQWKYSAKTLPGFLP